MTPLQRAVAAITMDPLMLLDVANRKIGDMPYPQDETEVEQGEAILKELLPVIVSHLAVASQQKDNPSARVQAQGFLLAHVVLTAQGGHEFHLLDFMEQVKKQVEPEQAELLKNAQEVIVAEEAAIQANPDKEELVKAALDPYVSFKQRQLQENMKVMPGTIHSLKFDFSDQNEADVQ